MDKRLELVILSISVLAGLLIICNSKHPININIKWKSFSIDIGTKKENR